MENIKYNLEKIIDSIPKNVQLVVAAKSRTMQEVKTVLDLENLIIGENYIQEATQVRESFGKDVNIHFIGHLQKNKINKAIETCNFIQTVDSFELAQNIDKRCEPLNKVMSVLIEINSGREDQKHGLWPENAIEEIKQISKLEFVKIKGLMTMGPFTFEPKETRPYFKTTKQLFNQISALNIPDVEMDILSMGMSNSYQVAIEEGATMIRIGSAIFGPRSY